MTEDRQMRERRAEFLARYGELNGELASTKDASADGFEAGWTAGFEAGKAAANRRETPEEG